MEGWMVEEDLMSRYSALFLSSPAVEFAVTNPHIPAGVISLRMDIGHGQEAWSPALRDPLTSEQIYLGRAVAAGAATADYKLWRSVHRAVFELICIARAS